MLETYVKTFKKNKSRVDLKTETKGDDKREKLKITQ